MSEWSIEIISFSPFYGKMGKKHKHNTASFILKNQITSAVGWFRFVNRKAGNKRLSFYLAHIADRCYTSPLNWTLKASFLVFSLLSLQIPSADSSQLWAADQTLIGQFETPASFISGLYTSWLVGQLSRSLVGSATSQLLMKTTIIQPVSVWQQWKWIVLFYHLSENHPKWAPEDCGWLFYYRCTSGAQTWKCWISVFFNMLRESRIKL